jgi:hypothetical protein
MKNFQNKTKIIKVSVQLRAIARLSIIGWTIGLLLFLFGGFQTLTSGYSVNAHIPYLELSGIAEMVLAIIVSLNFFRFFDRLKNGELFDARTVDYLTKAGQWWLAYWIFDFTFSVISHAWFNPNMAFSFGQLFASLLVIFVAWLLKEAQVLQEEQQLTV